MPIRQKRHYPASRLPLFLLTTSAFAVTAMPALAADTQDALPLSVSGDAATESSPAIVVTARRRTETAQDVPIALSVISSDALAATGNLTLGQTQQLVPSLQVFSYNPRNTNINIRGLGSNVSLTNDGLENGVGVYIDNVYYGRVGQSQFDLVDLSQIEVLRGPQGTLFGKNTTAGAINITSKPPSFDFEASGEATLGNYGYHQVRGSVSGPLIGDSVAARLSVSDTHRDGFIDNVLTGQKASDYDNFTVRGQLLVEPSDTVKIRLIGDYSKQTANCCVNLIAGVFPQYEDGTAISNNILERWDRLGYEPPSFDAFARKTDANSNFQANMEGYGLSGQIDWDLGGASLTSITAYRWWDWDPANDADATSLSVLTLAQQANRQRQFSQELRLASDGQRTIDWVVGLYYFWQTVKGDGATEFGSDAPAFNLPQLSAYLRDAAVSGLGVQSYSEPRTRSYAAFGQATWNISDALSLTAGLRYTFEQKRGVFRQWRVSGANLSGISEVDQATALAIRDAFAPEMEFSTAFDDANLSGVLTLSYKAADDLLLYATYSRGGKSGGLNLTALPDGVDPDVAPETVNNWEAGFKSQFWGRRITLNAAAYWTEVDNYQTAVVEQVANTVSYRQYIANAGSVRSRGIEADLTLAPTRRIGFNASLAYTDARYLDYENAQQAVERLNLGSQQDLSGARLSGVPKFTWTLGSDASQPIGSGDIELYAHADYSHRSSYFTAVSNSAYSLVAGYGLLNARIGLRRDDGRWDISLWARNLTDADYFTTLNPANTGLITAQIGDPRTVGVTLRTQW